MLLLAKSIKPKDNVYIDSTGIVHNRNKLNDILNDLDKLRQSAWTPLTLTQNWGAFDNNSFNSPCYRIVGNMVCLKGLLKRNDKLASNEVIATLPVEARPPKRLLMACLCDATTVQRIDIHSTGEIKTPSSVADSNMISLESITFFID